MRGAECHEPVWVVIAALFAWLDMMHIEKRPVLAARNDASIAIAAHHLPADRRRG